jgi:hypothetical protein
MQPWLEDRRWGFHRLRATSKSERVLNWPAAVVRIRRWGRPNRASLAGPRQNSIMSGRAVAVRRDPCGRARAVFTKTSPKNDKVPNSACLTPGTICLHLLTYRSDRGKSAMFGPCRAWPRYLVRLNAHPTGESRCRGNDPYSSRYARLRISDRQTLPWRMWRRNPGSASAPSYAANRPLARVGLPTTRRSRASGRTGGGGDGRRRREERVASASSEGSATSVLMRASMPARTCDVPDRRSRP